MAKHTIRDILPPENRRPKRQMDQGEQTHNQINDSMMERLAEKEEVLEGGSGQEEQRAPMFTKRPKRKPFGGASSFSHKRPGGVGGKLKYLYIAIGIVGVIFILSFLFSLFFGGAQVTVHPKQQTLTVSGEFSAVRENPSASDLKYEIMTLESLLTKTVEATGREEAEEKASGEITVFNNYNESPQRLIRNTRFETPEGLIYRIDKSVVVPGKDTSGDIEKPGEITVTVYADEPGEKYNIGITNFTIPGFKGAPQFEGFYAKSETAMKGGFVGERLSIDETTLASERKLLRDQLEVELRNQIADQQPEGFLSFNEGIFIDFVSETPQEKGDEIEIREKAVLYNVLFPEAALAQFLAQNTLADFDGETVAFLDSSGLTLSGASTPDEEEVKPWSDDSFSFALSGTADIVWQFDEEGLKNDLSGRNKEAIQTILSGYPSIDEAEVVIRPFWRGTFPVDVAEIKVETVITDKAN